MSTGDSRLDFAALCDGIRSRLRDELGDGPQPMVMPAWLARGRR
jgi:2-polyprenyl-6-methoxyphenol hydroxylase-like FAD-dependent oxidoreductase